MRGLSPPAKTNAENWYQCHTFNQPLQTMERANVHYAPTQVLQSPSNIYEETEIEMPTCSDFTEQNYEELNQTNQTRQVETTSNIHYGH